MALATTALPWPQCIKEVQGLDVTALSAHVAASQLPFSPSNLYEPHSERTVVDEGRRRSKFRLLKDSSTLDMSVAVASLLAHAQPWMRPCTALQV
jgi:hypothetical protein